jgi:hypothetical protein
MQRSILAMVLLVGLVMGAAGLGLLLFSGGAAGEPAAALPASTDVALLIPSVPDLLKDLARTRMAPAPGESGWDLLADIIAALLEARAIAFSPDPGWLARTFKGGAALGWVPSETPGAPAHLVLTFETPSRVEDLPELVERTILPELGPAAVFKTRSHRGHAYGTIRLPGAPDIVCVSSHGRLAIVTVSGEAMRQALTALRRREASLLSDPHFRKIRRDLRERAAASVFVSGRRLKAAAEAARMRRGPVSWLAALAEPGALQGAGVSITIGRRGQFRERARLLAAGLAQSLPGRLFPGSPGPLGAAARLPRGFPLYVGVSVPDPGAAWERLPEMVARATGREAAHVKERAEGLEAFLGLRIGRDVLGVVGGQAAAAVDPGPGGAFLIALRPSDPAGARRLLARLDGLARAADAYRPGPASETLITTYEHPRLAPRRLSWAFAGEDLLLADDPGTIRRALERPREAGGRALSGSGLARDRAHIVAAAETGHVVEWLRAAARAGGEDRGAAWLRRLQELLPGSAGPLPPTSAKVRLGRDGLSGEWSAPVSPVILAALLLGSPAGPPAPEAAPGTPPPAPAEPAPTGPSPAETATEEPPGASGPM